MTSRVRMAFSVTLLCGGCDATNQPGAPQAYRPCPVQSSNTVPDRDDPVVVVRGTDAPCTMFFASVVTLGRDQDATLPRPPVTALPGGRWVTATYADGEMAMWSPSGEFERLIGLGPGDGPGEFGRPLDLVVDSVAGTIHVLSRSTRVEVYSLDGEYLRAVNLPTPPFLGARLSDGTIATSTAVPMASAKIMLIGSDTAFTTGPPGRMLMPAEVRAGGEGVWTAESPWYQFDHHTLADGQVTFSIRREVDWFPQRSLEEGLNVPGPLLMGFTVDPDRQSVFARVEWVADPEAPSGAMPEGGTPEERLERNARYFDGVIEAFTFEGELVATFRFDDIAAMPRPVAGGAPGNHWFRLTGDLQSIEIFRPEVVEGDGRE